MHLLRRKPLRESNFLCISVIRVASGPRMKLASCKSALTTPTPPTPQMVDSTDRSKAVDPVVFVVFFIYSTRRFILCLTLC